MTLRESIAMYEKKISMLNSRGYRCEVCGREISPATCQLAHVIPQTKNNLRTYGKAVLHHPLNLRCVCSLKCNSAVLMQPATHPKECKELVDLIRSEL